MEPLQPRRNASEEIDNPSKRIKSEDPAQFSAAVKKKLQSSSRTGQACDRCKVSSLKLSAERSSLHLPVPTSQFALVAIREIAFMH